MSKALEALNRIAYTNGYDSDIMLIESELNDFEWLKSKISFSWIAHLEPEDWSRLYKIIGGENYEND